MRKFLIGTALSTTAVLLFLPKLLSLLLIARTRTCARFGSFARLLASVVFEILLSTLLAPVRMWFHSKFVVITLMGRQIGWGSQQREDSETTWGDAFRQHGLSAAVALALIAGTPWLGSALVCWVLPVAAALFMSVPLSVFSSRASVGSGTTAGRRWPHTSATTPRCGRQRHGTGCSSGTRARGGPHSATRWAFLFPRSPSHESTRPRSGPPVGRRRRPPRGRLRADS